MENKVGGNAIIAAQTVINAPADGHTLLWAANGPVTTNVALYNKLPYDPLKDFAPVARVAYSPMGLYVPANSPYRSAAELFDAAKKQPMKLNCGSGSATYNIASEWLMSLVGHAQMEFRTKVQLLPCRTWLADRSTLSSPSTVPDCRSCKQERSACSP